MKYKFRNSFRRQGLENPYAYVFYTLLSWFVAFVLLLKVFNTNLVEGIVGSTLFAVIVVLLTIMNELYLEVRMGRRLATQVYYTLLSGPFTDQAKTVIVDWRRKGKVFPNQLKILAEQCQLLGDLAQIARKPDWHIKHDIEDNASILENTLFKNIKVNPKIISANSKRGYVTIRVAGKDLLEWENEIHNSKSKFPSPSIHMKE